MEVGVQSHDKRTENHRGVMRRDYGGGDYKAEFHNKESTINMTFLLMMVSSL